MPKLEGIIYKAFGNYVVLRGFAPIRDLASISHKPESYQRKAELSHKEDIVKFLDDGEYKYFPEITLACRVKDYIEFASNIGVDSAIDRNDAKFVPGLKVLSERLPYAGYRARHANLEKNDNLGLVRVDGNHRLEPFDDPKNPKWIERGVNMAQIEKLIVPFTVIFSAEEEADKFEAGIFHNINFRQEPLRQEASLKIINDLDVFDDKRKLGLAYPLAVELIREIKGGMFNNIHWLKVIGDSDKEFYRTACLKMAQILFEMKEGAVRDYSNTKNEFLKKCNDRRGIKKEIDGKRRELSGLYDNVKSLEIEHYNFVKMNNYRRLRNSISELEAKLKIKENKLKSVESTARHLILKGKSLRQYIVKFDKKEHIIAAILSLSSIYNAFDQSEYGNIAMLSVLVYYSMIDKVKLGAFVNWINRNGINKITNPDDLSHNSARNLIKMFEQIYQAKKSEIFVSMQFGDSQSELIYEKVVRAIEEFNKKHQSINLRANPIRIDRTVESSTYPIQSKILEAINSCSLLIADLSSANINVYHEIGYAMGVAESNKLQPNMILLYKEDSDHNRENKDTDKFVGFNLRSLSQLRFRNYKELVDGLVERLEKHFNV